jgi:hypothetical protein
MTKLQTDKHDRLIQTAAILVYQQGFHQTTTVPSRSTWMAKR